MPNMTPKQIAAEYARSPETQAMLRDLANQIAAEATSAANSMVGRRHVTTRRGQIKAEFGTDVEVDERGARAHVWAMNGPAIHAERKEGILAEIANQYGKGHKGRESHGVVAARRGLK